MNNILSLKGEPGHEIGKLSLGTAGVFVLNVMQVKFQGKACQKV